MILRDWSRSSALLNHGFLSGIPDSKVKHRQAAIVLVLGRITWAAGNILLVSPLFSARTSWRIRQIPAAGLEASTAS